MILSFTLPRQPQHPLEKLDRPRLRAAGWASTAASLSLGAVLLFLGRPLQVPEVPRGLVSFELAWRVPEAEAVLSAWGPEGRSRALLMTWVDYPFLAAYGLSLAALSLLVPGAARLPAAARAAAWAAFAAAGLDAAENGAALAILHGTPTPSLCLLQAACAAPKFLLAALSLGWVAAGAFIKAPRD